MKILALLVAVFLMASCSNSSKNSYASNDSLVIQFKSIPSGEVIKTINTKEEKAIRKIADFIDGDKTQQYKCGYNGELIFYKAGKLASTVSFNTDEACKHFLVEDGGKNEGLKMSNEAASFLTSLADGKSWY